MKHTLYITAIAAAALMFCCCQREELAGTDALSGKDGIVKYAPSVGGIVTGVKSSVSETVPAATRTQSLTLMSEDGTYTLPMSLSVTGMEAGMATKATLINETGALKSLGDFAASIDNTFWVAAWSDEETPEQIIPDAYARDENEKGNPENHGFKDGGYVSRTDDDGYYYQKVLYRTKDVSDNDLATPYWMTVQPQTADNFKTTIPDADDEYIWKKAEAEKRFYAYANVPTGATVALLAKGVGQTMTVNSIPADKDALLGYYYGDGSTASSEDRTGTASIHFYHPLTAVKFKQGTLPEGVTVTGISITGVYESGKTTQNTDTPPTFAWTTTGGSAFTKADETGSVTLASVAVDESTKQIGETLLFIPETFAADSEALITVTLDTPDGATTVYYPLKGKTWAAGYTNVLTIGYDTYEYTFELEDSGQATQTFSNSTTDSDPVTITVTSTKTDASGKTAEDWRIRSYRVGSGAPVDVRSASFTGGGLQVSGSGSSLSVKALKRTESRGSHDYWVNTMKRTEGLDWSPAAWYGITDLSKLDPYTDKRNAHQMTTANCYIIRHAGTYKLPLVYGNAVQDGIENRDAYAPTMADGGSNFLSPFHNHLGNGIGSAFIENNADSGGSNLKCAVVWQDNAAVISEPQIVGAPVSGEYDASNVRYLQFTVSQEDICQNNALVCIYKDANGNGKYDSDEAVWSWHIWTTNDPALLDGPITVTNHTSHEYDFFPLYSLGWIDACYQERETVVITLEQTYSGETVEVTVNQPAVATAGSGTYYQFGRKDPMPTSDVSGFTRDISGGTTLGGSIASPAMFFNGNTLDWLTGTHYYNLWTGKKSEAGLSDQDNDMIKTIYDPSPVGYKIPASNAATGFTTTGGNTSNIDFFNVEGDFNNGWHFYTDASKISTAFFATAWYRDYSHGEIKDDVLYGRYWTATPEDGDKAYRIGFNSGSVNPVSDGYRAAGFSVRPVLE